MTLNGRCIYFKFYTKKRAYFSDHLVVHLHSNKKLNVMYVVF